MSQKDYTAVQDFTPDEIAKAHRVLYNEGIKMRIQVAGKEYVEKSLKAADNPFARPMQEYVAEACWGSIWTRPGLELKTRSFLNIAMLCCQNRGTELATHVRGALTNGATAEEICEVILHASSYCGMPSGIEGFRVAAKAVEEWKKDHPEGLAKGKKGVPDRGDSTRHEDLGADVRMNVNEV